MASRFEDEEDTKRDKPLIADMLAPKGKPKVQGPGKHDMAKVNAGPNIDDGGEYPSELNRDRYQLVDHGFKSIYDRIVRSGGKIEDDQGVNYWFKAITGDSNTGYFLTVRPTDAGQKEQVRTIKDFRRYGVQGNPLHPYTFEARVLPAITEYRRVKASGLGVDQVSRMLMDAITFLADERVATFEKHEAFKAEMRDKLAQVETLIREERSVRE